MGTLKVVRVVVLGFWGLSRAPRSPRCRARFAELMKNDAEVINQRARQDEKG